MTTQKNSPQDSPDQRQEYRLTTELTIFIELPASDIHSQSDIVVSKSLDISANGMRVITDRELPSGSILRTCVHQGLDQASNQQFILITEIKWARPYGDHGEFLIGLSLFESEGSDIQGWKEFIAQACAADQEL
jgi:hypothetical protein